MNQKSVLTGALASVMALGLLSPAAVAQGMGSDKDKDKCFGVAKAGQNDCSSLSGTHDCAGMAKVDNSPDEWKLVPKGTCKSLKGYTEAEAKRKVLP